MDDKFLNSLIVKRTKEEEAKESDRIGLIMLRKFVNRHDYKKALLRSKGRGGNYRITCWRNGRIYVLNDCYGAYPPNGINSLKMNLVELKERFEVVE